MVNYMDQKATLEMVNIQGNYVVSHVTLWEYR